MSETTVVLREGEVLPGDEVGQLLGFTADRFDGYLWVASGAVIISAILSLQEGRGHLRELFAAIWGVGYVVKVPTALPKMERIVRHWHFRRTVEPTEDMGPVEVWVRETPPPEWSESAEASR